jgi:hypothetical protein
MRESAIRSRTKVVSEMQWIRQELHDLAQPLTALECGLYLGTMSPDGVRAPRAEELLESILAALTQCERITARIRGIQDRMNLE